MTTTSIIEKIYSSRLLRLLVHVSFWLLMLGTKLYLTLVSFNTYRDFPLAVLVLLTFISTLLLLGFYYCFVYVIVPRLIMRRRYLTALLSVILMVLLYTCLDTINELQTVQHCHSCLVTMGKYNPDYLSYLERGFLNTVLTRVLTLGTPLFLLFALCIPFSIKMAIQSFRSRLQSLELARDNLQLEFNFLKSQLNPHFLFNSMNNIYGLIMRGDNERSAELVARLSDILRYTLYDSDQPVMPLKKEIAVIQDYIELEKIRLNETTVEFELVQDAGEYALPPLLLMPLVENAFKHSGDRLRSFISIRLTVERGRLSLEVENTVDESARQSGGGIGITNLKKRLMLYYPDRHDYQVTLNASHYAAALTIEL